jgi:hypothetical protein
MDAVFSQISGFLRDQKRMKDAKSQCKAYERARVDSYAENERSLQEMISKRESEVDKRTPLETDPQATKDGIRAFKDRFASEEGDLCALKVIEDERDAEPRSIMAAVLLRVKALPADADDAAVYALVRDCYIEEDRQDVRRIEERVGVYTVYYEQMLSGLDSTLCELDRMLEQAAADRAAADRAAAM